MSDVVRVVVVNDCAQPDPDVIAKLEELLTRARAGEINGLVFSGIRAMGFNHHKPPLSWWGGAGARNAPLALLGSLELVKDELIEACQETTRDLPYVPEEPA